MTGRLSQAIRHGLDFPTRSLVCHTHATPGNAKWRPSYVLHKLAKDEGLKAICERLRYAHRFAQQQGREEVSWDDVMSVHAVICTNASPASDWS